MSHAINNTLVKWPETIMSAHAVIYGNRVILTWAMCKTVLAGKLPELWDHLGHTFAHTLVLLVKA
jgi:hypothetical protein